MMGLASAFFAIALLYSSVGFGGGSSYIALLSVLNTPYQLIPLLGLVCNTIVSGIGVYHFTRAGHYCPRLIWPFLLGSAPCALLGGLTRLTEPMFFLVLSVSLFSVSVSLLCSPSQKRHIFKHEPGFLGKVLIGSVLGILAGLTGIGGGIFLSPLLLSLGWGKPKEVAGSAALFILFNSVFGLMGHFSKIDSLGILITYSPLFIAVGLGGFIGSFWGASDRVQQNFVTRWTGFLTLMIACWLFYKQVIPRNLEKLSWSKQMEFFHVEFSEISKTNHAC